MRRKWSDDRHEQFARSRIRELTGEDHSYIELFARNTTPGWDVWGNEVNKYGN